MQNHTNHSRVSFVPPGTDLKDVFTLAPPIDQTLSDFAFAGHYRFKAEAIQTLKNLEQRSLVGRVCTLVRLLAFNEPISEYAQRLELSRGAVGDLERVTDSDQRRAQRSVYVRLLQSWLQKQGELEAVNAETGDPIVVRKIALLKDARTFFTEHVYGDSNKSSYAYFRSMCLDAVVNGTKLSTFMEDRFASRIRGIPIEFYTLMCELREIKPELPWQEPPKLWATPEVAKLRQVNLAEAHVFERSAQGLLIEQIAIVAGYAFSSIGNAIAHEQFSKRCNSMHLSDEPSVLQSKEVRVFLKYLVGEGLADAAAVSDLLSDNSRQKVLIYNDPRAELRRLLSERHLILTDIGHALGFEARARKELPRRIFRGDNCSQVPLATLAYLLAETPDCATKVIEQAIGYESQRIKIVKGLSADEARCYAEHSVHVGVNSSLAHAEKAVEALRAEGLKKGCEALRTLCQRYESVPGTMNLVARVLGKREQRFVNDEQEPPYVACAKLNALETGRAVPTRDAYAELVTRAGLPFSKVREAAWQEALVRSLGTATLLQKTAVTLLARFEDEFPANWQKIALECRIKARSFRYAQTHADAGDGILGKRFRGEDPEIEVSAPTPVRLNSLLSDLPERNSPQRKIAVASYLESAFNGLSGTPKILNANLKLLASSMQDRKMIAETAQYLVLQEPSLSEIRVSGRINRPQDYQHLINRRDGIFSEVPKCAHPDVFVAELQLLFPGTTRAEVAKAIARVVESDPKLFS